MQILTSRILNNKFLLYKIHKPITNQEIFNVYIFVR